jgi:hypothetical protein
MVKQNVKALKTADNLKWDFNTGYQKSVQVFNYNGEMTDELRQACQDIIDSMGSIKEEADVLLQAAQATLHG